MLPLEIIRRRQIREKKSNDCSTNYLINYFRGDDSYYPKTGEYLDPNSNYKHRFIDMLNWIIRRIGTKKTVLDVGGGVGWLGYWAKKNNLKLKIIHTDISINAIRFSKEHYRHPAVVSSAESQPFAQKNFDAVIFADVLEHLQPEEALQALQVALKILKSGGRIFINIPNRNTWTKKTFEEPTHIWIPTIQDIKSLLKQLGFTDINISTRGFNLLTKLIRRAFKVDLHLPFYGTSIFIDAKKE